MIGTHKDLEWIIPLHFNTKEPFMIWGPPGIGKSVKVVDTFTGQICQMINRKFLAWNKVSEKEKESFIGNDKKIKEYLIFIDERTSIKDPTDNKGLPKIAAEENYLKWLQTLIINIAAHPDACVVWFKDEINNGVTQVLHGEYQFILDRAVNDITISPHCFVICAGNRDTDGGGTTEMPLPLLNRMGHFELTPPSIEEWTAWAIKNDVDSRIIGFLNSMPSLLYQFSADNKDKAFPTPRTWAKLSNLVKDNNDPDKIRVLAGMWVGDAVALQFTKFIELGIKIKIDDYFAKPELMKEEALMKIKKDTMDLKHVIISAAIERYRKKPECLPKMTAFLNYMGPKEFNIYMLKMIRGMDDVLGRNYFKSNIRNTAEWTKIIFKDYAKYLVDEA